MRRDLTEEGTYVLFGGPLPGSGSEARAKLMRSLISRETAPTVHEEGRTGSGVSGRSEEYRRERESGFTFLEPGL